MASCIFCDVVEGKIPAKLVHEDHLAVAFHDVSPKAPTHVLVIPRQHLSDLDDADPGQELLLGHLLLVAKVDRRDRKLAVVANRTRKNTKSFEKLMRFLDSLGIPIIAVLRDSQNYVHAASLGLGIYEMSHRKVKRDIEQMDLIINWLDQQLMQTLEPGLISRLSPVAKLFSSPATGLSHPD